MKKILSATAITLMLFVGSAQASTWSFDLDPAGIVNSGGTDYYSVQMSFNGELTDNLTQFDLSLGFDTSILSYAGFLENSYSNPGFPSPTPVWVAQPVDVPKLVGSEIYGIMSSEPLTVVEPFLPVSRGETLMTTAVFAVTDLTAFNLANVVDLVYFTDYAGWSENVYINGLGYSFTGTGEGITETMFIAADGQSVAPVPIPGAVWLLGSGLAGMVAMRRKKK